ncbi:hypothetical protein DFQ30_007692 [Apophysomyces sp. BC1015]|nr:hypothetical protein DFQ30_007692 [Apophysomyces sp. BC1015]KAG0175788.1 hypothetical protein DFQ29_007013 [Apophysomyces sp. BC1021]
MTTSTQTVQLQEDWATSNASHSRSSWPSIQHRIHAKGSDTSLELGRDDPSDPLLLKSRRKSKDDLDRIVKNGASRKVQQFYHEQNNLIDDMLGPLDPEDAETKEKQLLKLKIAIYGSVFANVILFALQLVAAITSGSLSIFATMADSFMDLLSSVVLMWTARQAAKINLMKYPAIESGQKLASRASEPDLTYLAIGFIAAALGEDEESLTHPGVQQVDTCRAYYAGNNLFVEVDIVLPPETPLRESHDIGEELQIKLESVPSVERAFVHVDYETSHKPEVTMT